MARSEGRGKLTVESVQMKSTKSLEFSEKDVHLTSFCVLTSTPACSSIATTAE
jgi:hypothetical protein